MLRRRYHPQKKLLEKQKEGKKKMRNLGTVQVPHRGLLGGPQAGQRLILFCLPAASVASKRFAAGKTLKWAEPHFRPFGSDLGTPQKLAFVGQAKRRCGTWGPYRFPPRPSWPSSSWTAIDSFAFPPQVRRPSAFAAGKTLKWAEFISGHLNLIWGPHKSLLLWGSRQEEDGNLGTVQVPTEAFMAVLKLDSD